MECSVEVCDRPSLSRGWCSSHYRWAWARDFEVDPTHALDKRTEVTSCKVSVCDRPSRSRGYCDGHYAWWKTHDNEHPTHTLATDARIDTSNWTREGLAWLAGFLDGEGCFPDGDRQLRITACSTDRDLVERCREVAGCGHINGPYDRGESHWKPRYRWSLSKYDHVYALAVAIYQWMGNRRRESIRRQLHSFAN